MTSTPSQSLTVRLPDDVYQYLRQAAFDQHTSINALIIEAVRASMMAKA